MPIKVIVERGYRLISDMPTTVRVEGDTVDEVVTAVVAIQNKLKQEAANQTPPPGA